MGIFSYFFGDGPDTANNGFDHQKIYNEWQTGPGVASLSQAAGAWSAKVGEAFKGAHAELEKVLKDSEVAMQGAGGDAMRQSTAPLQRATRESVEVSNQVGSTVEQQAQASSTFKHSFPPPAPVPPSNIGWQDYLNPSSYAIKKGMHMAAEQHHDEVEAEAKRQYTEYTNSSYGRTGSIRQFSPVPKFTGDVSKVETQGVGTVNADTGYTGNRVGTGYTATGYTGSVDSAAGDSAAGNSGSGIGTGRGSTNPGSAQTPYVPGNSGTSTPESPASNESAWVAPPPATASPLPGTGPVTPGPTNSFTHTGGPVGGPSTRTGSGTPTGRGGTASGRGGTGSGAGRGGPGSGTGTGRGGTGTGGRSGSGTGSTPRSGTGNMPRGRAVTPSVSSTSSSSSGTMRGAPMGGANRGQQGEGDAEHENKYALEADVIGEDLNLPRTAPAVIGEDLEPQKPPQRPAEERKK